MTLAEAKVIIDAMGYEEMLRRWRTHPAGSPLFQGEIGKYYSDAMAKKREQVGNAEHVRASKSIGW